MLVFSMFAEKPPAHRGPLGYSPLAAFYSHGTAPASTTAIPPDTRFSSSPTSSSAPSSVATSPLSHTSPLATSVSHSQSARSADTYSSAAWPGAELLDMLRAAEMRTRLESYAGFERHTWAAVDHDHAHDDGNDSTSEYDDAE